MSDIILNYKNKKTGSYICFPDEDIESFIYIVRIMNYQDQKILKKQRQKLVNVLKNKLLKDKE